MEVAPNQRENIINVIDDSVSVVLVGTTHSGNIGAVARAMKNMGLSKLSLVAPKDFPSSEADARSAGAGDILESAKVFDTLEEAISGANYVVGASARSRSFPWPLANPRDAAKDLLDKLGTGGASQHVALVFGRESSGLTNDELQRCNLHVNIPANPNYSSLNLAMAVQVICYELRMTALVSLADENSGVMLSRVSGPQAQDWDAEPSTSNEVDGLLNHLTDVITKTGFFDPTNPGMLLQRLRRLFQRAGLDKMEVNILRGILKSIEKKIDR